MSYVPYETLARLEAGEIMLHLLTALGSLSADQLLAVQEIVADGYVRGLDAGFALTDFAGLDPANAMEIYNAGIAEGKKQ